MWIEWCPDRLYRPAGALSGCVPASQDQRRGRATAPPCYRKRGNHGSRAAEVRSLAAGLGPNWEYLRVSSECRIHKRMSVALECGGHSSLRGTASRAIHKPVAARRHDAARGCRVRPRPGDGVGPLKARSVPHATLRQLHYRSAAFAREAGPQVPTPYTNARGPSASTSRSGRRRLVRFSCGDVVRLLISCCSAPGDSPPDRNVAFDPPITAEHDLPQHPECGSRAR